MRYNKIRKMDISNGPGVRVSVFMQGCTFNCKNCFNPETHDFKGGKEFTDEVINKIMELCSKEHIVGLSILGGEPMHPKNIDGTTKLAKSFKEKYPNIEKVAVVKQNANNRDFISAYYVANKRISIYELRKYLSKSLPRYMIPSYYVPLEEFIYTPNGKIDRKKLPLPQNLSKMSNEEYIAPKNEIQKKLVKIFENISSILLAAVL